MANSVTVEIKDGVATSIPAKIDKIATSARTAHTAVEKLQKELNALNGNGLERLNSAVNGSASALSRLTQAQAQQNSAAQNAILQQQRLATETARTATQQQRLQTESSRTATQQQRLATETQRTTTQTQRLATETQRTATQQANAASAATRQQIAQERLNRELQNGGSSANSANAGLKSYLQTLLSLATAFMALRGALSFATEYTIVNNKIKTVTDSIGQQETLLRKLTATALETSTGIDVVSQSFIRFDRPMKQMGKTQEETIRLITTINKELSNTGATTTEAASAVLQLGQAFGSGKLQGDEFRSLSENMPTLLDAVAKAMNVTTGEVKKLGTEGKITSAVLLTALTDMQAKTDETFAKTQQTVPQAMQNFKTAMTISIGEMDKALGVTENLAKGLNFLANNMEYVGVAAATLGALLLVAFGAPLLTALTAATSAVVTFTVALASNPLGLLLVGISAAIAYIIAFGDEIKIAGQGMITLQDVALGVWDVIADALEVLGGFIMDIWNSVSEFLTSKFDGLSDSWGTTNTSVADMAKTAVNFVIGTWVAAFNTIRTIWNNFPAFMDMIFTAVINLAITAAEKVVNSWQIGLRALTSAVGVLAPELAGALNGAIDKTNIKLDRAKATGAGVQIAKDLAGGISSAMGTDYVGKAVNAVMGKALTRAINRSNANTDTPLRGAGDDLTKKVDAAGAGGKGGKGKGKSPAEKLTEAQKDYKKALDEINKPLRDFNASVSVANDLLKNGVINQDRHNALIMKASDEYMKAIDPMYSFNKAAIEQYNVLQKVGVASEAERQIIQARNSALQAGLPFTEQMSEKIRETADALDMQQRKHDALNDIWENSIGLQRTLIAQQLAYNDALAQGALNSEQYAIRTNQLKMQQAELNLQMGSTEMLDIVTAGLQSFMSSYEGVMSGLSTSWGSFFDSFASGFADSIGQAIIYGDSLSDSLNNVAKQALAGLISALVKLGIQYLVNSMLAKTSIATTTTASATAAAATAAAWSPAAAMVSLASFGANAMPANVGIASTVALTKGLSMISGFKTGGFTGNVGVNEVAGLVHGKEFVMNANATDKYRPLLESLNSGASVRSVSQNASNAGIGGGINVNIQNFGTNKDFEVQQLSETDVRIIARDEADKSVRKNAPSTIAKEFANANSEPSKALSRSTTTERNRP